MGMIYTLHGVKKNLINDCMIDRGLLDYEKFERFLRNKKAKFVSITDSLNGKGDSLTIDDATKASASAAMLAAEYGHNVTFFINPWNIINKKPYHFHLLNIILERTSLKKIFFNESCWDLRTYDSKHLFREYIKKRFWKCEKNIINIYDTITFVANKLKVNIDSCLPDHMQIISKHDIINLINKGVNIGCHGWTHINTSCLNHDELMHHIMDTNYWLKQNFNIDNFDYYSTPFGFSFPNEGFLWEKSIRWLLLESSLPNGFIDDKIYNRVTLKL